MDKRVAQYFSLDSWLIWSTVRRPFINQPTLESFGASLSTTERAGHLEASSLQMRPRNRLMDRLFLRGALSIYAGLSYPCNVCF